MEEGRRDSYSILFYYPLLCFVGGGIMGIIVFFLYIGRVIYVGAGIHIIVYIE